MKKHTLYEINKVYFISYNKQICLGIKTSNGK